MEEENTVAKLYVTFVSSTVIWGNQQANNMSNTPIQDKTKIVSTVGEH